MATILTLAPLLTLVLVGLTLFYARKTFMVTKAIQDAIGRIDAEATAIGTELAAQATQIQNLTAQPGGMSAADSDAVAAQLNSLADRLTTLASPSDPNAAPVLSAPVSTDTGSATTGG